MRRLAILNQLREDLIEVIEEMNGISRHKSHTPKRVARLVALRAEASTIRAMIRHLERENV